jgi:general nucleoside transport system permease protein
MTSLLSMRRRRCRHYISSMPTPTFLPRRPRLVDVLTGPLVSIAAVVLAFACGAVMIAVLGADPWDGFVALVDGAFGGRSELADTAVKATPLLLVGTGICISFRARVINIGGEGQILAGATMSVLAALVLEDLPRVVLVTVVLVAGVVGGAAWGAVPGALKAYLGVNEILSTIMLNIVAVQIVNYLLRDPLIDPAGRDGAIPQTKRLSPNADLPVLLDGTRLHLGFVVAVLVAVLAYVFLWRTSVGYRLRAVGAGAEAARYAGIPVARMTVLALTLSGAMCGLAGAVLVFGSESHRFVTDGSSTGFTGSAGFNGIVAALFGGLHPLWTIPASVLFGGLLVGANNMQRAIQIPASLVIALNGLVVMFVVASGDVRKRLARRLATRTS